MYDIMELVAVSHALATAVAVTNLDLNMKTCITYVVAFRALCCNQCIVSYGYFFE